MRESSVILARLSFKKHSRKTLRLCYLEPNQHAYIRKELLYEKASHGYAQDYSLGCQGYVTLLSRATGSVLSLCVLLKLLWFPVEKVSLR